MKICVQGLWHLGSVTAACLAYVGHDVVGLDDDLNNIKNLKQLVVTRMFHISFRIKTSPSNTL